jgi:hypothetical protein
VERPARQACRKGGLVLLGGLALANYARIPVADDLAQSPRRPQACLRASGVARLLARDLDGLSNARRSLIKLGRCRVSASAER